MTLVLVALSVGVFVASRVLARGKALTMLSAILAAVAAIAAVADSGAEPWQTIALAVSEIYVFLQSIIGDDLPEGS